MHYFLNRSSLLTFATNYALAASTSSRPNIDFIFTDDQRYDATGHENPAVKSPNQNQLANEGVIFDNAFVNTSVCSISRANVMIGQSPLRHGIDNFHKTFPASELASTYPALMKKARYYTIFIGKWGIGHSHKNSYQAADFVVY